MTNRDRLAVAPLRWLVGPVAIGAALAAGCKGDITTPGGGPGSGGELCAGTDVVAPKRIIRLSFNQMESSIRALLGDTIADKIALDYQIADAQHRTFPPLSNPREGAVVTDTVWTLDDQIAQEAAQYVHDNFGAATGCGSATDACAQGFVTSFATKAFRHPLSADESAAVTKVYTDVKALGLTVEEATQYGVYAALSAPQFLYRTEFGTSAMSMGSLTPYELASAVSYFLTDGPPDAQLLAAAANGGLASSDQLRAQVTRILGTDAARANLEAALFGYFAIPTIETIVVDTTKFPEWNDGLRNSMRHESELFLHDVLWGGLISDLLTSRTSTINASLATLYGVTPFPQPGAQMDADGFAPTQLPDNRSGIITQSGFLVARARPDRPSVVGRGLLVNATFLCGQNPAFPAGLQDMIAAVTAMLANATEREKAAYRADPSHVCSGCHPSFDPYGLALENYDILGKYRTVDDQGRPIDASVTLPPSAGSAMVANAVEMAGVLATNGAFAKCMANNMIAYALAEPAAGLTLDSCAVSNVARAVAASDGSFTSLVAAIVESKALSARSPGGAQ